MPTLMCKIEWKICIPAALHGVIQEKRPDSCEPTALKFAVHLFPVIHFRDVVLRAAVHIMYLLFSLSCYVGTLFRCGCSSFFILLCCYYIKLRNVCGMVVGKIVNWKHLVGSRFCLIYLLSSLFVVRTVTPTKTIGVTRVSANIRK